jgi:protocatechuate 3,4-dioxygenase beta subunit
MERKDFLKSSIGLLSLSAAIEACKKDINQTAITSVNEADATTTGGCIVTPDEVEGPFPYPSGERRNPLNRSDVRENQKGVLLTLIFTVVNTNNACAPVPGARVDIWHCNNDGYYSGYINEGYLGTKNSTGQTWLRGYQLADNNGRVRFTTTYPGWYKGRATHIHFEVFINRALRKIGQIAFPEDTNNEIYATRFYRAHGPNPKKNMDDGVLGNSPTDLANETVQITKRPGSIQANYTIGLAL